MSFLAIFKFDLETTLKDLQNDFYIWPWNWPWYDLGWPWPWLVTLIVILPYPPPPPSQVSPCNFEVNIQSMQHQKQLVYINQHMSPSIKFARSPLVNAGFCLMGLKWPQITSTNTSVTVTHMNDLQNDFYIWPWKRPWLTLAMTLALVGDLLWLWYYCLTHPTTIPSESLL